MEQNKTGKYLKYAIGEIALVVIGILIALSIHSIYRMRLWFTWDQTQKHIVKKKVNLTPGS